MFRQRVGRPRVAGVPGGDLRGLPGARRASQAARRHAVGRPAATPLAGQGPRRRRRACSSPTSSRSAWRPWSSTPSTTASGASTPPARRCWWSNSRSTGPSNSPPTPSCSSTASVAFDGSPRRGPGRGRNGSWPPGASARCCSTGGPAPPSGRPPVRSTRSRKARRERRWSPRPRPPRRSPTERKRQHTMSATARAGHRRHRCGPTFGKRGGALANWHPVDLLAFALSTLVERTGVDPDRVDDVIGGCVSQVGEQSHQRGPQRLGGRRPAPVGAGHDRRPPVRLVPAGDALRRRRGGGRALRPGRRLRRRVDEPRAPRLQRPGRDGPVPAVVPRRHRRPAVDAVPGGPAPGRALEDHPRGHGRLRAREPPAGGRGHGLGALRQGGHPGPDQGRGGRLHRGSCSSTDEGIRRDTTHGGPGRAARRRRAGSPTPPRTSPPATRRRRPTAPRPC